MWFLRRGQITHLLSFCHVKIWLEVNSMQPRKERERALTCTQPFRHPYLKLWASRTVRSGCLLFISQPVQTRSRTMEAIGMCCPVPCLDSNCLRTYSWELCEKFTHIFFYLNMLCLLTSMFIYVLDKLIFLVCFKLYQDTYFVILIIYICVCVVFCFFIPYLDYRFLLG